MMPHRLTLLALAPLAVACVPADGDSVGEVRALVPDAVEFPWNEAYDAVGDGLVAVVPLDVMVYDDAGLPVAGVDVELASDDAAFVDVVVALGVDGASCADGVACAWDAYADAYVELGPDDATEPLVLTSDADGLVRAYAVVDAAPRRAGRFGPGEVRVRVGGEERSLHLEPR